ncbi:MAG TPA: hypothetical protein VK150_09875 [Geothrix sp.]|nr:hypothetical protein [Geothrix sp.]
MKIPAVLIAGILSLLLAASASAATLSASGFRFWLPEQWKRAVTGTSVTAAGGKEVAAFFVGARSLADAEGAARRVAGPMIGSMVWGTPEEVTINRMEGYSLKGRGVIAGSNLPVKLSVIAVQHGRRVFVACFAVASASQDAWAPTIRRIVASIAPIGTGGAR